MESSHLAVAHVCAVDQGLNLQHETVDCMSYDDSSGLLLVAKGAIVFAYDLVATGDKRCPHEQLRFMHPLAEGPKVSAMRCSLDGKILSLQRSTTLIEFVEVATGITFVAGSDKARKEILGWFFTEAPGAEVVVVTKGGLELNSFVARRHGLRLQEVLRTHVHWYRHTHETRMVLVCSGGAIQAWQFVSSGIVSLPPFSVTRGSNQAPNPDLPPAPTAAAHVRLLKLYGRVYCAHINQAASVLELYRFFTDTVVLQHSYELFSPHIQLSVVDNVLLLHHTDSAVTMLIDVAADMTHPITQPLPLALNWSEVSRTRDPDNCHSAPAMDRWQFLVPNIIMDLPGKVVFKLQLDLRAVVDSGSDLVALVGFLQRRRSPTQVTPELANANDSAAAAPATAAATNSALGTAASPVSAAVGTGSAPTDAAPLPHRAAAVSDAAGASTSATAARITSANGEIVAVRQPATPQDAASPRALLVAVVRAAIRERLPLQVLHKVFDDLVSSYANAEIHRQGRARFPAGTVLAPQVISAESMHNEVFKWLHDEKVVEVSFLQAVVVEFLSSALAVGVVVPAALLRLRVELLLEQGQEHQVVQLLTLQPGGWLMDMAEQVEELTATTSGALSGAVAAQLALGLRLQAISGTASIDANGLIEPPHGEQLVRTHLRAGRIITAARLAKDLGTTTVRPIELLQAAAATGQVTVLAAVYRLYRDALMPTYPKFEAARNALLAAS